MKKILKSRKALMSVGAIVTALVLMIGATYAWYELSLPSAGGSGSFGSIAVDYKFIDFTDLFGEGFYFEPGIKIPTPGVDYYATLDDYGYFDPSKSKNDGVVLVHKMDVRLLNAGVDPDLAVYPTDYTKVEDTFLDNGAVPPTPRENGISAGFSFPRVDPEDSSVEINAHVIDSGVAAAAFYDRWWDPVEMEWLPGMPATITAYVLEELPADELEFFAEWYLDEYGIEVEQLPPEFVGAQLIYFQAGAESAYIESYFDTLTYARKAYKDDPKYLGNEYADARFEGFSLEVTQGKYNEAAADVFGLPEYWDLFIQYVGEDGVKFSRSSATITPRQWLEYLRNS
ncbi:MAG: hypothetical protein LBK75_06700 [Oscillospiraceae bacterium]|nr:hypothetical protein [Oscillospiraceae bacterium]